MLANAQGSPVAWIGGSDAQQDGIWFWSDGSRFAFTLWGTGETNNWMTPESCLQMNAKATHHCRQLKTQNSKTPDTFPKEVGTMTSVASILLLSVCAMSSASELIVQSETRTEDSSALRSCPKDWELFDQRCFRFISTARTWAEAERFCLLLGGHLASVHSVAEYHFIQGLIVTQTHDSTASWIGGSDAQQNGIWFWSDGSRFTFTLWNPGEPNNGNGGEQCLHMNWGGTLHQVI
ncbi:hypothetical protein AALO_G00256190 [Alosa alosa]|uniref:C-type lectin domain-containing protein n=1 Tax=Alosa alosa TaxID=278164 RepID=A0AAV6FTQ8_9TELE|nr:hypothetical protein AALO_G00256190 [Alosa alosa]